MRRETAMSHVRRIAQHLKRINGILATPNTQYPAAVIRRAWVFGSTAKGSPEPADVDILLDMRAVGERTLQKRGLPFDKNAWKCWRVKIVPETIPAAVEALRENMRNVSFHLLAEDAALQLGPLQMIYPRLDFVDLDWRKVGESELLRKARFLDAQAKSMPAYGDRSVLQDEERRRADARNRFIEVAVAPAWSRFVQAASDHVQAA